ncbi:MAG: glycosyltransferase family 2 protein [Oscillatoriophycideae cyanobacterium NC_groundwater_1537_Pr4_S-0.65um_50_18]|nr:glycosyltransferase family 2 protein [Oscillatoriophycideae cyanobacterium NC_groundwater_1537_Pr4_S-0.65um_50_18]
MVHFDRPPVLVSILMPLYNAEPFVAAALTSILQERSLPLEVIIINDGSTDDSLSRVRKIRDDRVRVVDNVGTGIAAALNAGLAIARGQIIARCDADDLYPHQRLSRQIDWLLHHPEYGAVCGGYAAIDPKGHPIIRLDCGGESEDITEELRQGTTRTHLCTFAIRAEVLRSLGGFRDYFCTGEDVDFQLRLGEIAQVWYIPEVQYHYRLHGSSITHTQSSAEREFFNAIAREFQKQRYTYGEDDIQRGCPPVPPKKNDKPLTADLHIQSFLLSQAWREYHCGQLLKAVGTGVRSLLTKPSNWSIWRSLLALLLKTVGGSGGLMGKVLRP